MASIKIQNARGQDISQFKLKKGENKIGNDATLCNVVLNIPRIQGVHFIIYITKDEDVYLLVNSTNINVYKESSIPQNPMRKVILRQNFPYEMIPGRWFYVDQHRFTIDPETDNSFFHKIQEQFSSTVVLEDNFSGTMVLDDLPEERPQQPQLQLPIQSTMVLDDRDTMQTQFCGTMVLPENNPLIDEEESQQNGVTFDEVLKKCSASYEEANSKIIQEEPQPLQEEEKPVQQSQQLLKKASSIEQIKQEERLPSPPQEVAQKAFTKSFISSRFQRRQNSDKKQSDDDQIKKEVGDSQPVLQQTQVDAAYVEGEFQATVIDPEAERVLSNEPKLEEKSQPQSMIQSNHIQPQVQQQQQLQQVVPKRQSSLDGFVQKIPQFSQLNDLNDLFGVNLNSKPNIISRQPTADSKIQEEQPQPQPDLGAPMQEEPPANNEEPKKKNTRRATSKKSQIKPDTQEENSSQNQNNRSKKNNKKVIEDEPVSNRKKVKTQSQAVGPKFKRVAFSGFNANEIPQKSLLKSVGLDLVESKSEPFDILIMKDCKRTLKFLYGLIVGAAVVTYNWIEDCFRERQQVKIDKYIPNTREFTKQYGESLPKLVEMRDAVLIADGAVSIFKNFTFVVEKDVRPSKEEIQLLLTSGGGNVIENKPKKRIDNLVLVVSETSIAEDTPQMRVVRADRILEAAMVSDFQKFIY